MTNVTKMSYWQKSQLQEFEEKFVDVAKDNDGTLWHPEIKEMIRNCGYIGTDDDIKTVFGIYDNDSEKEPRMTKDEFLNAMKKVPKISLKEMVLRSIFKKYDLDKSGFMSKEAISTAVSSEKGGLDIPANKVSDILKGLVPRNDKKVSYEEFLSHLNFNETSTLLHELFYNMDTNQSGNLLKYDMYYAVKAEPELVFNAAKLLKMISNLESGPINYGEYVLNVAAFCKK